MSAATLGWQDIAHAIARRGGEERRPKVARAPRGRRVIPQETIRQIRIDSETMTRTEVARKHGVSPHYVYQVVECGIRDDERETLR